MKLPHPHPLRALARLAQRALLAVVDVAAWVWVRRAVVLDSLGGGALVVASAMVAPAAGWLVAGIWLTVRGYGIEQRGKTR